LAKYVDKEGEAWEAVKKQFPIGAKVKLNVGGPVMAVKKYEHYNNDIICQWFSGKKLESGQFAPETLVLVKDDAEEAQPS
jgi:uncharacterized protein YodC (DUF2158 family)